VKPHEVKAGDFLFVVEGQPVLFIPSWYDVSFSPDHTAYKHTAHTAQQSWQSVVLPLAFLTVE
jgi:hypothetical protein